MLNISLNPNQRKVKHPPRRLKAIVEFANGELSVIPIADSDLEEREILDILRVFLGER
jgi:hypothetical protein